MAEIDRRKVLEAIPLFAEVLDNALLDALAAKSRVVLFDAGRTLMSEGDFGVSMFAIVEGTVAVSLADRRGGEHDVAHVGAGDIVGEMSLMTGARRSATVTAATDVTALEITKVGLEEILIRAPELIDRFGVVLAKRQAELARVAAEAEEESADAIASRIRRFFPAIFGGQAR